ncbi:MAG: porin [Pseudomonadota bacterium]
MRSATIFALLAGSAWPTAIAQNFSDTLETDADVQSVFVFSPGRDDAGDIEAERALYELGASLSVDGVLDNGAEVGLRIVGRVQRDHPARSGFSGNLGITTADVARGAFSGLTASVSQEDASVRAQLEAAYIYIDGGYGELLAGRDLGVSARFFEGAPNVFSHARVDTPYLDSTGIVTSRTLNDLTGPSFKVSYAAPRLLGVRLGVSVTPEVEARGLDRDPERNVGGVESIDLGPAWEAAISVSRPLPGRGPRLRAYGAVSGGQVENRRDVTTWSLGGNLEWTRFSLGGSWLTSNNGGGGRYTAWTGGVGYEVLGLDWSATYSESRDDLAGLRGDGWSFGARRKFADFFEIAAGLQEQGLRRANDRRTSSLGPVIEISLGF